MTKRKSESRAAEVSQLPIRLLDELIATHYRALKKQAPESAKLGDWLKMIELRRKLQPDEKSQTQLWNKLEAIRKQLLKNGHSTKPDPTAKRSPARRHKRNNQ